MPQPEVVVFCQYGHPLTQQGELEWDDLLDYPVAMTRLPEDMERQIQTMSTGRGGMQKRIECDNVAMLVSIVAGSQAVSIAPRGVVASSLASKQVATLNVKGVEALRTRYGVVQRNGRPLSPAAAAFRSLILDGA